MGRRRSRKAERRLAARGFADEPAFSLPPFAPPSLADEDEWEFLFPGAKRQQAPPAACGGCREFVEDEHGGRGECLHPGSGILSPWTDTPGCPFFAARRGW